MTQLSGNYLYFKAPFRTHFSLQIGNVLSAGKKYHQFWGKVKNGNFGKTLSNNPYKIEYIDHIEDDNSLQFESVSSDANALDVVSPQVMEITPDNWITEKIIALAVEHNNLLPDSMKNKLSYEPGSCVVTIFKNTIANMDMLFKINLTNKEISDDLIDAMEKWTNQIAKSIIAFLYDDFISPLIKNIHQLSAKEQFISPINNHYGFPDINNKAQNQLLSNKAKYAVPLWVSRMLVIDNIDEHFDDLIRRWIITTYSKDEVIENLKHGNTDEKNSIYIGWMHSVYVMRKDENDVWDDARQAISLIQYYYAVLDSISANLSQIIGVSHKKKTVKQMQIYKSLLEEMVFITNLNKTEFADVKQSLQRNKAFFFNDLMNKWTVNNLFDNVDKKIELCKENIDKIYQKAFNRSQKVAELLLFFISGFAILEFLKGISEFFWSPENYKDKAWGLYALGRTFDPNTMLWFGISVFLVLFIVYTTIIKRQR